MIARVPKKKASRERSSARRLKCSSAGVWKSFVTGIIIAPRAQFNSPEKGGFTPDFGELNPSKAIGSPESYCSVSIINT
jgi:hypothetical protein